MRLRLISSYEFFVRETWTVSHQLCSILGLALKFTHRVFFMCLILTRASLFVCLGFNVSVFVCDCFQLGEHERALRLLVHKLRDFPAAENYCLINTSESDIVERARLFHLLLSVYLDPNNELVVQYLLVANFFLILKG